MSLAVQVPLSAHAQPVATLGMYDLPELQAANDQLWAGLARRLADAGVEAPAQLARGGDLHALWRDPGLLLGQTCGYPLVSELGEAVRLVATPCYVAPGCTGPHHRSAIMVASGSAFAGLTDLRGAACAVNALHSNTGMNLLRAEIAPLARDGAFFGDVQVTGAHLASLEAVADGMADVAAIDCVTLAHVQRLRPDLARAVRRLQWTRSTPGLPLVTAATTSTLVVARLREALNQIAADPALAAARRALLLDRFEVLSRPRYDLVADLEKAAVAAGYPVLA